MAKIDKVDVEIETPNFMASASSRLVFIPQQDKKGKEDKGSIPVKVRGISMTCKRSGISFRFPFTSRGGVQTFGDTRESANVIQRRSVREMRVELSRMVGEENADRLLNIAMF